MKEGSLGTPEQSRRQISPLPAAGIQTDPVGVNIRLGAGRMTMNDTSPKISIRVKKAVSNPDHVLIALIRKWNAGP